MSGLVVASCIAISLSHILYAIIWLKKEWFKAFHRALFGDKPKYTAVDLMWAIAQVKQL